jgi:hypothetical protein
MTDLLKRLSDFSNCAIFAGAARRISINRPQVNTPAVFIRIRFMPVTKVATRPVICFG